MARFRTRAILPIATLVTLPLLYVGFRPIRLVHIQIRPAHTSGIRILSTDIVIRSDRAIAVFFDFKALVDNPTTSKVTLHIRPWAFSDWYAQQDYSVAKGFVMGTAQLGSRQWPVKKTERYAYRLQGDDGTTLSEGQIDAVVDRIARADSFVVGGLGLLAAAIEVLSTLWRSVEVAGDRG